MPKTKKVYNTREVEKALNELRSATGSYNPVVNNQLVIKSFHVEESRGNRSINVYIEYCFYGQTIGYVDQDLGRGHSYSTLKPEVLYDEALSKLRDLYEQVSFGQYYDSDRKHKNIRDELIAERMSK